MLVKIFLCFLITDLTISENKIESHNRLFLYYEENERK